MKHLPADLLGGLGLDLGQLCWIQELFHPLAVLGTAADAAEVVGVGVAATQPWWLFVWEEGR